jgi:hypothetical protein
MLGWSSSPRLQHCKLILCNTGAQQSSYCRICSSAQKERQFRSQHTTFPGPPSGGSFVSKVKMPEKPKLQHQNLRGPRLQQPAIKRRSHWGQPQKMPHWREHFSLITSVKRVIRGLKSAEREEDRFALNVSGMCNRREETHIRASFPYACRTLCTSFPV